MAEMFIHLVDNYYETVAMIVFAIGFTALLLHKNMIKKVIGLNLMDTSMFLFLTAKGYIQGGIAPVFMPENVGAKFINPLPTGLVLTGIVVSVSVTAIMLSLTMRMYKRYHSLDIDEIVRMMQKEVSEKH